MKTATAAALFATLAPPLSVRAETPAQVCSTPLDLIRLNHPLQHVAQKLSAGDALTIVAIGSSSTAGAGASSPAHNYPSQLALELQHRFPNSKITMINRGVNGEEVADMLKRFDQVIAVKPDLVLWQLGTEFESSVSTISLSMAPRSVPAFSVACITPVRRCPVHVPQ